MVKNLPASAEDMGSIYALQQEKALPWEDQAPQQRDQALPRSRQLETSSEDSAQPKINK